MSGEHLQQYHKAATVKAIRMQAPFTIETLEGTMRGEAGDYLCIGEHGDRWPVKREIFEATYKPCDSSCGHLPGDRSRP
jgi:hypothetical protein